MAILNGLEDYLIVDVFQCLIYDKDDEVLAMDRLTSANLNIECTNTEIRGGRGNGLIATVGGQKDLSVVTSEPTFRIESLVSQLGTEIKTGAGVAYKCAVYNVVGGKVTLEEMPIAGTIRVFGKDGITKPTAANKEITITGDDEKVKVVYQYASAASSEQIEISSKKFPTAKKMVLDGLVINAAEEPIAMLQIVIPQIKADGNFSIQTQSEKQAVSSEVTWKANADANGTLGYFNLIPVSEAV